MNRRKWLAATALAALLLAGVRTVAADNILWPFGQANKAEKPPLPAPPRFKDNGDGTVTDLKTGLIWLKQANCAMFFKEDASVRNSRTWYEARVAAKKLSDGFCGLTDKSKPGDWRLPNREELLDIANNAYDQEKWTAPEVFIGIQSFYYWSSTTGDLYPDFACYVSVLYKLDSYAFQLNSFNVLPVRGTSQAK